MKLKNGFKGTCFSEHEISVLGQHLSIADDRELIALARMITVSIKLCDGYVQSREATPDITQAKRRLERIANGAAILARHLEESGIADQLIHRPGNLANVNQTAFFNISMIRERESRQSEELVEHLGVISANAERLLDNSPDFMIVHNIHPDVLPSKSPQWPGLWPHLFEIWHYAGKRVAKTPNGRLHKFVSFIHSVAELPPVSASTLRDAVAKWIQDELSANSDDHPTWWRRSKE